MIFLIDYDRSAGEIVEFRKFRDVEREKAKKARLTLELRLNRKGIEREVVLLEASSERALRKTHRRYFEDVAGLAKQWIKSILKGRRATRSRSARGTRRPARGAARRG